MLALKRLRLRIRHAERQRDLWGVEGGPHYAAAVRLVESLRAEEAALVERAEREAALKASPAPPARAMRVKRAFTRLQCPHCKSSFRLSVQMLLDAEGEGTAVQPIDSESSSDSTPDSHSESTRSKPSELV